MRNIIPTIVDDFNKNLIQMDCNNCKLKKK